MFEVNYYNGSHTMKKGEKYENLYLNDVIFRINFSNIPSLSENNKKAAKDFHEIINFIIKNIGLIELIEKITPIIKKHFPDNSLALEFERDPDIPSFNKLAIYVKGNDESFDEDWEELKKVNKEIRTLSLYDDSVKSLLSLDLW